MTKKLIIMGILMIPFLLLARMATAQSLSGSEVLNETYKFQNPELVNDLEKYEAVFKKVDLNLYRLQNESFLLKFDNGLIVEVYSAEYLKSINKLIGEINTFPISFSKERYESVFSLVNNENIVEARPYQNEGKITVK